MKEVQKPDTAGYRIFNEFFVRPLRDEIHPIDTGSDVLVIPANGAISQLGKIEEDKILQTKGHNRSSEALLAGNYLTADLLYNGTSATTYLSPRDYRRVHMPCDGILREATYVPGDLFSVNHLTAQNVSNLFACNERVTCLFDIGSGPMAQILVGTTVIDSTETVWAGTITLPCEDIIKCWAWPVGGKGGSVVLLKGQEMGCFRLGSTVISLFTLGKVNLVERLGSLFVTKIGQLLAVPTETFVTPDAKPTPPPAEEIETERNASPLIDDKKNQV